MLVLSRKTGETIVVGDDIRIVVTGIKGNRVTIGVTAPRAVTVLRGEIHKVNLPLKSQEATNAGNQ